jgi:hypothetical protein
VVRHACRMPPHCLSPLPPQGEAEAPALHPFWDGVEALCWSASGPRLWRERVSVGHGRQRVHGVPRSCRHSRAKPPKGGSLTIFREQLADQLATDPAKDKAQAAVEQLVDITRIRNGRLHTDASNWVESLHRLGVPVSDSPTEQWERIRAVAVGGALLDNPVARATHPVVTSC